MSPSIVNALYSFLSFSLKALSGLILPFVVSRVLGTDFFSAFSLYLIVGSAFLVLCEYGSIFWMPNLAQKKASDLTTQFHSELFCEALNARIVITVIIALFLAMLVFFERLSFTDYMLILAIVLYSFFSLFYYNFRSFGLFKSELGLSLKIEIPAFLIPVFCLLMFSNYEFFVLTFFGVRLCLILVLFRIYEVNPRFSISATVKTLHARFFYFSQVAISFTVLYVDTFFVKYFYPGELYLHQGFLRLSLLFCLFIPIVNSILLYYMRVRYEESIELYFNFFKRLAFFSALVSIGFAVFSLATFSIFVSYLLGAEYAELHRFSLEFSLIIFLKYLSTVFGLHLTVIGLQSLRARVLLGSFLVGCVGFYFSYSMLDFSYVFVLLMLFNLLIFVCYFFAYFKQKSGAIFLH